MQVGEADFFWEANGRNQFPDAAAQVEAEVQKYKQVGLGCSDLGIVIVRWSARMSCLVDNSDRKYYPMVALL